MKSAQHITESVIKAVKTLGHPRPTITAILERWKEQIEEHDLIETPESELDEVDLLEPPK